MYVARELRIASMAAKATVESVDQARVNMQKHGRNNVQIENHLEELRIRAAQSEQILRMTVRTAESLGMDLTEGTDVGDSVQDHVPTARAQERPRQTSPPLRSRK
jgi:hypothetical protein